MSSPLLFSLITVSDLVDVTPCLPPCRPRKLLNSLQASLRSHLSVRTRILVGISFTLHFNGFSAHPISGPAGRKTVTFDQVLAHTEGFHDIKPVPTELPETPFRPPAIVSETTGPVAPQSTPGLPANTPMAVQVLAGLLGLNANALVSQVRKVSCRNHLL